MEEQRAKARNARKVTNYMGADVTVYESIDPGITTEFVGYDQSVHIFKSDSYDNRRPRSLKHFPMERSVRSL